MLQKLVHATGSDAACTHKIQTLVVSSLHVNNGGIKLPVI